MNLPFIKTDDEETAQKLIEIGLELIDHTGSMYTFVNSPEHYFKQYELENIKYSNILTV